MEKQYKKESSHRDEKPAREKTITFVDKNLLINSYLETIKNNKIVYCLFRDLGLLRQGLRRVEMEHDNIH